MSPLVDNDLFTWMRDIRRSLHRVPELAYKEKQTSTFIAARLDELGISFQQGFAGGTGIRAELGKKNGRTPCVALRADMDGLPITEKTGLPFSSIRPGVMHACGHDGHVASLLGAAALLKDMDLPGRVVLLFQPGEESGNGAAAMIENHALNGVDMIFAGHIDTHFPVGRISVDEGLICSYTDPFTIAIYGSGGHAARPHEAVDAVVVAANLIMNMQTLVSRRINPTRSAVVTVGRIEAGTVHNVIAEHAVLEGTVRSADRKTRERILSGLERVVHGIADMSNAKIQLTFFDALPAVVNDHRAAVLARKAAESVVGEAGVISQGTPSLGGEDFSFYQQLVPGCMVRFGGLNKDDVKGPAHSSSFDFDEELFKYSTGWLVHIVRRSLEALKSTTEES